jgi:hypothetical protein
MQEVERPQVENKPASKPKEWVSPRLTRLRAGEAEARDISNTDGTFTS